MHSNYTQIDIDHLRLPLAVPLSALTDFRQHVATFRNAIAALHRAGQQPLPLEQFQLFLATLRSFPQFHPYIVSYTIINPTLIAQTFETLSAFLIPQLHNIIAAAAPNPFAGAAQHFPQPPYAHNPGGGGNGGGGHGQRGGGGQGRGGHGGGGGENGGRGGGGSRRSTHGETHGKESRIICTDPTQFPRLPI
jgi:uncharacterized membrane protein YgcG